MDRLQVAIADCDDINSNWACYGSIAADVAPVQYRFQSLRDRRPLTVLEQVDTDTDGVVFLNLHIAGETDPVLAMLFGDGSLTPTEPGQHSFVMTIDDTSDLCEATPPGMILHTQEGLSGSIELNGVTIELGSTAFVTLSNDGVMTIVNLEGDVRVTVEGVTQVLPVGYQIQVTTDGTPQFVADSLVVSPYYDSVVLRWLTDNETAGVKRVHNTNLTEEACVQELTLGEVLSGQVITNPGHECLYRFCTDTGAGFSLIMEAESPGLNPWLDLRGPDDLLLAFNNDVDASQADTDSELCSVGLGEPACYTVIARASENDSAGAFTIRVESGNTCPTPTVPRCDVRAYRGLNMRAEPSTDAQVIRTLAQNTHLTPIARSQDEGWIQVQLTESSSDPAGWVRNLPQFVQCEIQTFSSVPDAEPNVDCETVRGLELPPECQSEEPPKREPEVDVRGEEEKQTVRPNKTGPFGTP